MPERWRRATIPAAWYIGVTVAVPWLRGAGADPAFPEHALTVTALAAAAGLLYWRLTATR